MTPETRAGLVRTLADTARAERVWWLDAYYRRALCLRPQATAGDWLQYGHALKEAGRFRDAEAAYCRASELQPDDAEITLQIGHLLKVQGRWQEAARAFGDALALGTGDEAALRREIGLIRAASADWRRQPAEKIDQAIDVYLSAAVPLFDESAADGLEGLGGTDYSYAFAMRNFIAAFDDIGIDYTIITHPEIIADITASRGGKKAIHLGFYPPERIRLLKGAYNIVCFAWEFERLRSTAEHGSYHAFADQTTMLAVADEVWVPSSDAATMIAAVIPRPVHYVPAPVASDARFKSRQCMPTWRDLDRSATALKRIVWQPLAIVPRLQSAMNDMARARQTSLRAILAMGEEPSSPNIFLTILNVHDFRKQLRPMLEGFLHFLAEDSNACLLIKMTTPDVGKLTMNEFLAMDQISHPALLTSPMVSNRIWITDAFLTAKEMTALYEIASFYCCTSFAEGQNLPLLEAMERGVVPVSVNVTAMADYIDEEVGIVIRSTPERADHRLTNRYEMLDVTVARVDADDVAIALRHAIGLSPQEYSHKSALARQTVADKFNSGLVRTALDRVAMLMNGPSFGARLE